MNKVTCFRSGLSGEGKPYDADATPLIRDWSEDDLVLEQVFRIMNAVDGWEPVCQTRERSLSVGDTVFIHRDSSVKGYLCDRIGWVEIKPEHKHTYTIKDGRTVCVYCGEELYL